MSSDSYGQMKKSSYYFTLFFSLYKRNQKDFFKITYNLISCNQKMKTFLYLKKIISSLSNKLFIQPFLPFFVRKKASEKYRDLDIIFFREPQTKDKNKKLL